MRLRGSEAAGLTVRAATAEDVRELVRLETAAFVDPWTDNAVAGEVARPESTVLLAFLPRRGPAPLGYAAFRRAGLEAELLRVAVLPRCRRRGVARILLRDGLEALHESGALRCYLEVRPRNHPARRLYESLGFVEVGRRRSYYGDGCDALIYLRASTA